MVHSEEDIRTLLVIFPEVVIEGGQPVNNTPRNDAKWLPSLYAGRAETFIHAALEIWNVSSYHASQNIL